MAAAPQQRRLRALAAQFAGAHAADAQPTLAGVAPCAAAVGQPSARRIVGPPAGTGPRLAGKVAIVTGAGSGIGRASALAFARHGAKVFCTDWNEDACQQTVAQIRAAGGEADGMAADAGDEALAERVVKTCVERFGKLDVYFANAGVTGPPVLFTELSVDDFTDLFRTNVLGVFLGIKYASLQMQEQGTGGSILCTASVAGIRSGAGPTPYSASKAAVISLVQTTANQLGGTGIRVNAICPGIIETGMTAPIFEMARSRGTDHKIGQLNPLRRYGEPHEIANLALFLASDEASYINGQAIAIDGGLTSTHNVVPGRIN